jgi:hypothetical protein
MSRQPSSPTSSCLPSTGSTLAIWTKCCGLRNDIMGCSARAGVNGRLALPTSCDPLPESLGVICVIVARCGSVLCASVPALMVIGGTSIDTHSGLRVH